MNPRGPLGVRRTIWLGVNNHMLSRVCMETVARTRGRIIRSVRAVSYKIELCLSAIFIVD